MSSKGVRGVVILDNLAAHKSLATEKVIRARGAWLLFLPPYSPDLKLIEMAVAKQHQIAQHRAQVAAGVDQARDIPRGQDLRLMIHGQICSCWHIDG